MEPTGPTQVTEQSREVLLKATCGSLSLGVPLVIAPSVVKGDLLCSARGSQEEAGGDQLQQQPHDRRHERSTGDPLLLCRQAEECPDALHERIPEGSRLHDSNNNKQKLHPASGVEPSSVSIKTIKVINCGSSISLESTIGLDEFNS